MPMHARLKLCLQVDTELQDKSVHIMIVNVSAFMWDFPISPDNSYS